MSNDPYRSSSSSGSRSGSSEGYRSSATPSSTSKSPNSSPRPGGSPLVPALGVAAVVALGGLFWWHSHSTPAPASSEPNATQGSSVPGTSIAISSGNTSTSDASSVSAKPDQLHVLVAADVSRSVNGTLRQNAMDGLKFAFKQALPSGTPVHFVFYDRDARTRPGLIEFYEPRDLDEVSTDFVKYAPRPEKGTHQALALSRLIHEADALPSGTPTAFVLLTDGEDQGAAETTREAKTLAARPNFRGLLVIGAQMESHDRMYLRDQLDASLAPLKGHKVICGPEVSDRDADQFRAMLGS